MSTTDERDDPANWPDGAPLLVEARAEAERRYGPSTLNSISAARQAFIAGAEWQASRKVEDAPSDRHDHSGQPKVWCETHQTTHIAMIPRFTYLCKSCGFGQWYKPDAEAHEAACPGHETYEVEHVKLDTRNEIEVLTEQHKFEFLRANAAERRLAEMTEDDDEHVPLQVAHDDLKAEYAEYRKDMRKRLSRTSQPVQVEITDEMVEKAAQSFCKGNFYEYPYTDSDRDRYRTIARDALTAALGGGEHAE